MRPSLRAPTSTHGDIWTVGESSGRQIEFVRDDDTWTRRGSHTSHTMHTPASSKEPRWCDEGHISNCRGATAHIPRDHFKLRLSKGDPLWWVDITTRLGSVKLIFIPNGTRDRGRLRTAGALGSREAFSVSEEISADVKAFMGSDLSVKRPSGTQSQIRKENPFQSYA